MEAYLSEWLSLLVRWFHVIAGVAWIGASFYFIWLDNHLREPPEWKKTRASRATCGPFTAVVLRDRQVQTGAEGNAPGTALVQMGSLFNPA